MPPAVTHGCSAPSWAPIASQATCPESGAAVASLNDWSEAPLTLVTANNVGSPVSSKTTAGADNSIGAAPVGAESWPPTQVTPPLAEVVSVTLHDDAC